MGACQNRDRFAKLVKRWKKSTPAGIAQLVEQRTENPRVTGSSPVPGTPQKTLKSFDFKVF